MCASEAYIRSMPVKTRTQKVERFVARVTRTDKRIFEKAAALEGHSMATFVIAHAREAAERVLTRHEVIRLNEAESSRFVEALLAPPRPPTPAMLESMRAYRATVKSDLD